MLFQATAQKNGRVPISENCTEASLAPSPSNIALWESFVFMPPTAAGDVTCWYATLVGGPEGGVILAPWEPGLGWEVGLGPE